MTSAPPDVVALAEQRAAARAAKDFATSDRLRDEIAELGWTVRDGADGWSLAEKPPYDVLGSVRDLPDRSAEPAEGRCTVAVLVEGWPDDLRTCVDALLAHARVVEGRQQRGQRVALEHGGRVEQDVDLGPVVAQQRLARLGPPGGPLDVQLLHPR